jgi:hypothetical protein
MRNAVKHTVLLMTVKEVSLGWTYRLDERSAYRIFMMKPLG